MDILTWYACCWNKGAGVDLATERGATPLSIARAGRAMSTWSGCSRATARRSIPDFYDFSSLGPTLKTKSAGDVPTRQVLGGEEVIGVFFSGHWCPPSRRFTLRLVAFYDRLKRANVSFEVVFVSSDRDVEPIQGVLRRAGRLGRLAVRGQRDQNGAQAEV